MSRFHLSLDGHFPLPRRCAIVVAELVMMGVSGDVEVGPPHIDDATALLAAAPVRAIGIGFTSTAYVLGADGETAMVKRLEQRSSGIPVLYLARL